MNNYYNTIIMNLPSLTDEELDEVISQATTLN